MYQRARRGEFFFACMIACISGMATASEGLNFPIALICILVIEAIRAVFTHAILSFAKCIAVLAFAILGYCSFIVQSSHANPFYKPSFHPTSDRGGISWINSIQTNLHNELLRDFSDDETGLLQGMVFGGSRTISSTLKNDMERSGTSYILSMYGYKMACIAFIARYLGQKISRMTGYCTAIGSILVFLMIVGMNVSAIRGAIATTLALISEGIGRSASAKNSIAFAALLMLIPDPSLIHNQGFILSFLSVLGIIYLQRPLKQFFHIQGKGIFAWKEAYIVSCAANIAIIPMIVGNGDQFSLFAFASNTLIVLPLPFLMAGALLTAIGNVISPTLGYFISIPAHAILEYQFQVIRFFSDHTLFIPDIFSIPGVILLSYFLLLLIAAASNHE